MDHAMNDGTIGTLTVFTVLGWVDADGKHRMKKVQLEVHPNVLYGYAVNYTEDMKDRNPDAGLFYRFDAAVGL